MNSATDSVNIGEVAVLHTIYPVEDVEILCFVLLIQDLDLQVEVDVTGFELVRVDVAS